MALFDRFKKPKAPSATASKKAKVQGTPASSQASAPAKKQEAAEAKGRGKEAVPVDASVARFSAVLVKPHVSEKAAHLADRGVYVFDVPVTANKVEIRKAVERIYKVNVESVRTHRGIGKQTARGRIRGRRNAWKRALVQLKKGQAINLVEGV